MKLMTFRAATMPEALALVKRKLGLDAIILHTRTIKRGGFLGLGGRNMVEITARSGRSVATTKPRPRSSSNRLQRLYNNSIDNSANSSLNGSVNNSVNNKGSRARRIERLTAGSIDRSKANLPNKRVAAKSAKSARLAKSALSDDLAANRPVANQHGVHYDASGLRSGDNTAVQNAGLYNVPVEPMRGDGLKCEIVELRGLVENLVKEQRQLHAPQMPEQLFDMYLDLIQREVTDEIARELISHVQRDMTGDQIMCADLVRQKLVKVMDNMISTTGPISANLNGSPRVVVLIGPTGVGKTTSIAKIAANLKLRQNRKVGLITIDTYRIGAVDQLRMYSQIIDVPLKVVLTPAELRTAIDSYFDMDVVLIDTAGRSQTDELKLQELKTFLEAARADEVHLVLSGTANQSHMLSAAEKFKSIGVDRIILTKLDEAISFGVVLSVLRKVDASISYITTGQDVPDDIEVAGGQRLARMLLGLTEHQRQRSQYPQRV